MEIVHGGNGHANYTTTKKVENSLLLLLPEHIIIDVLARLPVYTIFSCKCVCQTLNEILSYPHFKRVHFAKASRDDYSLVIQDLSQVSNIFLTPLLGLDKHALYSLTNDHCNDKYHSWQTWTPPTILPKTKDYFLSASLVGSCNGLLCIKYFEHKSEVLRYGVCNPILGEFFILPQLGECTDEIGGFGFCPKTNQYKVLRFLTVFKYCDIFALGTDDEWRRIQDGPPNPYMDTDFDSSYKGNLHWRVKGSICCFNLETERYSYISLPSCFNYEKFRLYEDDLQIGTLDGLFCVSYFTAPFHFEVYVMKDYGVKDLWTKEICIDVGYNFGILGGKIAPAGFLDNGVLVLYCGPHLIYHDTRKGSTLDLFLEGCYNVMVHTPSLMSLEDIVRKENVEIVERKILQICCSTARKGQGK